MKRYEKISRKNCESHRVFHRVEKLFEANVVGSLKKPEEVERQRWGEDKKRDRSLIGNKGKSRVTGELFRNSKWTVHVDIQMCVYRGVWSNGNDEYRVRVVRTLPRWKVGHDSGNWIVAWLSRRGYGVEIGFFFLPASGGEARYKWLYKRTMMSRQSKDPVQKCHSDPGAASTGGTPCSPGKRISRRLVPGIPSSSNTRKCVLTLDGYSYVIGEYWITIRLELLSFWFAKGLRVDRGREGKRRIRLSYVLDDVPSIISSL